MSLIVSDGLDQDKVSAGTKNRSNLRSVRYKCQRDGGIPMFWAGMLVGFQHQRSGSGVVEVDHDLVKVLFFETRHRDISRAGTVHGNAEVRQHLGQRLR